ncbi:mitochondrial cardiolipin hydrolase [Chloropicon roscoffensis]|uniref:Mitochondrial cardiolipin hydrolase n=1 Tax=Chloropicon roscoffensis TaxID=1461544 RepID=A0AAX4P2J3_9CHLO|mmetsp:Transcript_735/g.2262  ORF Transcript_735/g.2262 Transcript_735/m.2262 type:complete len:200 (-) Transcript_735:1467-2066(-)
MGACLSSPPQAAGRYSAPVYYPPPQTSGPGQQFVLFFPDKAMPCRSFLEGRPCRRRNCQYSHEMTSLCHFVFQLRQARQTISCCVYTITCREISEELVDAHRRGVQVRVVTEDEKMDDKGSKTMNLRSQGISVRKDGRGLMHHKFAVVDGRTVLNGSFNWTRSAVLNNRENVVISQDPNLARAFTAEFERLWRAFARNR